MACRLLDPRSLSKSMLAYIWFNHLKKGNNAIIAMQENEFEIVAYKTAVIWCGLDYINCVWDEIVAMV